MTTAIVLMTRNEARALTKRIQAAGADFSAMLLEAHDGEAWRVLGYQSWSAYVEGAFTFTRGRSYQLLDHARVNQRLTVAAGEPVRMTERDARAVKPIVADVERSIAAGERPQTAYQRALAEQREGRDRRVRPAPTLPPPAARPSPLVQSLAAEQRVSGAIAKPSGRHHAVRGLDGLVAATRRLDEQYASIADERSADDALPPDLVRVVEHLVSTGGRLLR